jgi:RND family efflux transporter MFP subunit
MTLRRPAARLLAASLAALVWLPAASSRAAASEAPAASAAHRAPLVTVTRVARGQMVETAQVTGTLVAREDVVVAPQIEGLRIVEILAEEGDVVSHGQVLARLSRETLDAQLAQSDAQIARADAAIAQAAAGVAQAQAALAASAPALARARTLAKSGAGTDAMLEARAAEQSANVARLDAARQALAAAQADRKALDAGRVELDLRVARTQIKAPAAGVVRSRAARLGAIASAAAPEGLFRIVADGDVELDAEAPDFRLQRIKPGQPAQVVDGAGVTHQGTVRLVSPAIDRATRMGSLRIALEASPLLRVGGFARGDIETDRRVALSLPASAVIQSGAVARVDVVRDGEVRKVEVKTGVVTGGRIEIREGLAEGDVVVARAGAFLNDGDRVETRDDPSLASAGATR